MSQNKARYGLRQLGLNSSLKAGVSKEILNWLNFESFFFDLLASVGLGNKDGCKGQH